MRISYTTKTFEDIICYWVEATHISFMVSDLVEYTDEVGEEYDTAEWLQDEIDESSDSFVGLTSLFEDGFARAEDLRLMAEDKLKSLLPIAVANDSKHFASYKNKDITQYLNNIFMSLYEDFDEIYEYEKNEQVERFYIVLEKIISELI